jgi:thiamine transport system substrate-binding protein
MKKIIVLLVVVALTVGIVSFAIPTLTVYTYDSFISGMAKQVGPVFEKEYNCRVKFLSFGDSGNLLARLILEKLHPNADVVVGLSQSQLPMALQADIFQSYKPSDIASVVNKSFLIDSKYRVIPFDYGALAIDYNLKTVKNPPKSFEDLLDPKFHKSLVVEDPRTSSTGLDFLLWTIGIYKDKWQDYWKKLMPSIKTITSGWDSAFEMLEKGEARMMVSFATDEAYNYYYYKGSNIGVAIPSEGAYVMVEYAGILKNSKNSELAKKFMDFVLSKTFQSAIPLNQWMYPVTNVKLPPVYKYAPKISNPVMVDLSLIKENLSRWLEEWSTLVIR